MKGMPKSTRHKSQKEIPRQKESHRLRKTVEWILGISTIGGLILGALAFFPRPALEIDQPSDPSNALSAPLTVENASLLPLEDVRIAIGLCSVTAMTARGFTGTIRDATAKSCSRETWGVVFIYSKWRGHTLLADEGETIFMADLFDSTGIKRITNADIAILISYNPWFLPISRTKIYHLFTRKLENGGYFWASAPNR